MFKVNNFGRANALLRSAPEEVLKTLGIFLVGEAKKRTPVDTGTLRSNNQSRVIDVGDGKQLQIYNNTNYAIFVHEGTRKMRPRRFITDAINESQGKIVSVVRSVYKSKFGG